MEKPHTFGRKTVNPIDIELDIAIEPRQFETDAASDMASSDMSRGTSAEEVNLEPRPTLICRTFFCCWIIRGVTFVFCIGLLFVDPFLSGVSCSIWLCVNLRQYHRQEQVSRRVGIAVFSVAVGMQLATVVEGATARCWGPAHKKFQFQFRFVFVLVSSCACLLPLWCAFMLDHVPSRFTRSAAHAILLTWLRANISASDIATNAPGLDNCFWWDDYVTKPVHLALDGVNDGLRVGTSVWIFFLVEYRLAAMYGRDSLSSRTFQRQLRFAGASGVVAVVLYAAKVLFVTLLICVCVVGMIISLSITALTAVSGPLRSLNQDVQISNGIARVQSVKAIRIIYLEICSITVAMCTTAAAIVVTAVKIYEGEMSDSYDTLHMAQGMTDAVDAIGNCYYLLAMGGFLQFKVRQPTRQPSRPRKSTLSSSTSSNSWITKVKEMGERGVKIKDVLTFYEELQSRKSPMRIFDSRQSTTNDVVREAIIPMSYDASTCQGVALASIWNAGAPVLPDFMITHAWGNTFTHLVAAMLAGALSESTYEGIAEKLIAGDTAGIRERLQDNGGLQKACWICAFCVNQHKGICSAFSREPTEDAKWIAWSRGRHNTVTRAPYPLCGCKTKKAFNDDPDECEMNKFEDIMKYLHSSAEGFAQIIAMDVTFNLLSRAWCVAELVQARRRSIPMHLKILSEASVSENYLSLRVIDVRTCQASRAEDKALILASIGDSEADFESFNRELSELIFAADGLFENLSHAERRLHCVSSIVQRIEQVDGTPVRKAFSH